MNKSVDSGDIASTFVTARQDARALDGFPGAVPGDLVTSYAIQDRAIDIWPDRVVGWKVGGLNAEQAARFGTSRVVGPIFARDVWETGGSEPIPFPVFIGGFAAVEAEVVLQLGRDAPADRTDWTIEDAAALVGGARIGVETAGSPLATINELGPTVIASDFGNNNGLILGAEIPDWSSALADGFECETVINGEVVGAARLAVPPEGPLDSLRVLLAVNASRGRPLRAGDLVSTGAVTGVHDIEAGQSAVVHFDRYGTINCLARPAVAGG